MLKAGVAEEKAELFKDDEENLIRRSRVSVL
jgi:hypothetical protein